MRSPMWWLVGMAVVTACHEAPQHTIKRPAKPGPRLTMAALHETGGVPVGWNLTPPPGDVAAGRRAFEDLGCGSCHAVQGEPFPGGPGPELSGMGGHHPAEYFVEAILNPDAVLVDGPGYIGTDGHSTMPTYPDLSLAQLTDVVTYLQSLRGPEPTKAFTGHWAGASPIWSPSSMPEPPPQQAGIFFVQDFDVKDGKLAEFQKWLKDEFAPVLIGYDGFVSGETFVDIRRSPTVVAMFGFRDDVSLNRFVNDQKIGEYLEKFDSFIGPHGHKVFRAPPVYRAATLSVP